MMKDMKEGCKKIINYKDTKRDYKDTQTVKGFKMTKNQQKLTRTLPNDYESEGDDNATLNYKEAQSDYR